MVSDLKQKNPNKWYSAVKRTAAYENKAEEIMVEEINHLSNQEQCDLIADDFSEIPNMYRPLHTSDIQISHFHFNDIPQFTAAQVWKKLATMKANKSSREGDIPAKLLKLFAAYLAEPLASILNCSIRNGDYPVIWKDEIATPIPKAYPTS